MGHGSLKVIVGCMSSGKSEELIRLVRREVIARRQVACFKPAKDQRTDDSIESRNQTSFPATVVDAAEDIPAQVDPDCHLAAIDEAHFFGPGLLAVVEGLVRRGISVIVAGLDTDFRGQPFETVAMLMAVADHVRKLNAVCMRCGNEATRSQRLVASTERVLVGGDESYEARCRDCHRVPE
ncbi:hypothetical protein AMJ57_04845 [Parcubacteria bacterium SG8_24]|nr:MAG: hypothetical protein AMJ57_04845 [Parcubacteria bacterium SG8_24]